MHIYTLNIGQGQFVVVTGTTEAVIVDTYVPLNPANDAINVKGALSKILEGKRLVGLMITGFDADHFNEVGMKLVLNKYRPDWIMYPRYFKKTSTADSCFTAISKFEDAKKFKRVSVSLSDNDSRFYTNLSSNFWFEVFSPHIDDMNSSNNCSLVCKIKEVATGRTYLVSGDTENDRWTSIVRYFGSALASDVLAAPHHGSRNGISQETLSTIKPDTVIISAGVDNSYGHPHREAIALYSLHAESHYQTNVKEGQSLKTVASETEIKTYKFSF